MLKKQNYKIAYKSQTINIDGLNELYDRVCLFDSNENDNNKKNITSSKLIAVGATQEFCINNSQNALSDLQKFYDQKKTEVLESLVYLYL